MQVPDFVDQTVRIADLATGNPPLVASLEFERCQILGPAVIIPLSCNFDGCGFGTPDGSSDSVLWHLPEGRTFMQGAIRVERCSFVETTFRRVGVALPPDAAQAFSEAAIEVGVSTPLPGMTAATVVH
jgi:hypothetical protein